MTPSTSAPLHVTPPPPPSSGVITSNGWWLFGLQPPGWAGRGHRPWVHDGVSPVRLPKRYLLPHKPPEVTVLSVFSPQELVSCWMTTANSAWPRVPEQPGRSQPHRLGLRLAGRASEHSPMSVSCSLLGLRGPQAQVFHGSSRGEDAGRHLHGAGEHGLCAREELKALVAENRAGSRLLSSFLVCTGV